MTTANDRQVRRITACEKNSLGSAQEDALVIDSNSSPKLLSRNHDEQQISLLRCHHAEECRQQDSDVAAASRSRRRATRAIELLRQCLSLAAWTRDSATGVVRTVGSLPDVLRLSEGADVVSFDVFDTLLYRTVEPPDYLKYLAANFAAARYSACGYPVTADLILYLRSETEARQRRLAQSEGTDSECKLSEVVHEVLARLFGTALANADTALLVQKELDIESQHLRVAQGVPNLLEELKSRDKRIIATSDTYLELSHLQDLFARLGIRQWIDAIYVSSEHGFGKYSGRLFEQILKHEGIQPRQMIHVGDTYQSDVRGAVKAGVPALFLFDVARLRRRRRMTREIPSMTMPVCPVTQVTSLERLPPSRASTAMERQPELYRIGHDVLGPAFAVFVLDVLHEAVRIGAADIYYLAREGHLFRRLHEILRPQLRSLLNLDLARHHYLYVSRLATSLPAIHTLGGRELHLANYRDRRASLAECIGAFGLDAGEFHDLAIDFDNCDEAARLQLFNHREFATRVHARAAEARTRLRGYLDQEGFFNSRQIKILVDIGWNATIQANLTHAFEDDPEFPVVVGYYFGRRYRHEDYLFSSRSLVMPGRLFDQKRLQAEEHSIGHCLELFEIAAAAPHGATLGYESVGDRIAPVLDHGETELSDEQQILQSGIVDYALGFAEDQVPDGFSIDALRAQAVDRLAQLILRPTAVQAGALRNLSHALDWGSPKRLSLVSPKITPWLTLTPRRFYDALTESYWLEGCMRAARIPGVLHGLSIARRVGRIAVQAARLRRIARHYFLMKAKPNDGCR